jgi:hypothetical protein
VTLTGIASTTFSGTVSRIQLRSVLRHRQGGQVLVSRLGNLFPFKLAAKIENPKTTAEALDQKVQQRPIWMLSLRNLSLSFNGLNNNLTDAEITRNFGAVKTSGVTAKYAQTIATGLDLRVTRSSHTGGPFVATTIDYKRQTTGDVSPKISQINNRVTGEAGYIRNLRGGRFRKEYGHEFVPLFGDPAPKSLSQPLIWELVIR